MIKTLKFYFYHFMFEWHAARAKKNFSTHTNHYKKVTEYYERMKSIMKE